MKSFPLFFLIMLVISAGCAGEPALRTIPFHETDDIFPNPERGFYRHMLLDDLDSEERLADLREQGITLIYGKVRANDFRERDFSDEYLDRIQRGFDTARRAGVKVIFCVSYGDRIGAPDASKDQIFRHIDQLEPLLDRNMDVIYLAKAGFIGPWGEWHSSTHGLDTTENRRDILFKLLDALPEERMVALRTPQFKLEIFGDEVLSPEQAFDRTKLARTGFHNDCFLSSDDDYGTYTAGKSRGEWIAYLYGETRFTPFGGETCNLHAFGDCTNALYEMEQLHCSWLNSGYHPDVLQHWEEEGCMNEVTRRLGYRFVLREATLSDRVSPGGVIEFGFTLENVGFASPVNPRHVEVVLKSNETGREMTEYIDADPRFWFPGEQVAVNSSFRIPANLSEGSYSLLLRLPDPCETLHGDPRYSIRFASEGIWEEETGSHVICTDLAVTSKAGGERDPDASDFMMIR